MIIELLQPDKHQRSSFSCGHGSLDRFLRESAYQPSVKGLSRTYVAVPENDETQILGYYTVTTTQIDAGEVPDKILRELRLPKRGGFPASLIGRLAVSSELQQQGIGSLLVFDAIVRCARVANDVGGVAIVVDALVESVVDWYEKIGFIRFEPTSLRLFLLMRTARELLAVERAQRQDE